MYDSVWWEMFAEYALFTQILFVDNVIVAVRIFSLVFSFDKVNVLIYGVFWNSV